LGGGEPGELKSALSNLLLTQNHLFSSCPLLASTRALVALREVYSTASDHIHPHRLMCKEHRMSKNGDVENRKEERKRGKE
jgi:hypothetical protein